jgi:hypothetical protein
MTPDCLWHLMGPFALFLAFKDFFDCFKYQHIGSLYCAIGLQVIDGSEGYLCPDLIAKILEHIIVKLLSVVKCDFSQNTEMANDILPKEFLDSHGAYACNGLHLNPFCEIFHCYDSESIVALSWS